MRDRLPTLPHDLREYAWIHTGPPSVAAERAERASRTPAAPVARHRESHVRELEPAVEDAIDAMDSIETGLLVDLWHSDVPRVASGGTTSCTDHREAFVLSLLDGASTVGSLLEIADLPVAEVLAILCDLCARGVVTLDRSRRVETPAPNVAA
jgi:hypothetical protein